MRKPAAHEPSPLIEGDIVLLEGSSRELEVVLVTPSRVLVCSTVTSVPCIYAAKWEDIKSRVTPSD